MNFAILDDAGGPTLAVLRQALKTTQGVLAKISLMGQIVDLLSAAKPVAGKAFIDGNAVHQGTASPGDQGPAGGGSPDPGEGQTVSEGKGLPVTQPEDLAQTSAADDAVANGERPRLETKKFYEFDPNRKHSQRKRDNAAAIALLAKIDAGDLDSASLTDDDKQALAKYSGTGGALIGADGKKGSAYEYYTPAPIAEGMWDLLKELGASGGRCLDPCAATGVFGATAPANFAIDAVELNETSGRINGLVNDGPGYRAVVSAFEAVADATEDETYDVVASNVPFGTLADRGEQRFKDAKYQNEPIQNYFILRGLEKLRPGGLAMFITPPRCVSGRGGKEEDLRYRASLMAEFMGAYRLPNKVFGTADADTMTDVMVFRKFSRDVRDKVNELREQNPRALIDANVLWQEFIGGTYFQGEGKPFILGTMQKIKGRFGETDALHSDMSMPEIAKLMRKFGPSRIDWDSLEALETEPITYSEGDTIHHAGQTLQMKGGRLVALDSASGTTDRAELAATMVNLDTPLDAIQNKVTLAQATQVYQRMIDTARELDIPGWLRDAIRSLRLLGESKQNTYWNAGVTGLAVLQVMTHHQGEETGFDFLTGYADLSDKVQRVAFDAKKPPAALGGRLRDGMARIGVIYTKKTGFSAVWRGDVVTGQTDGRTESERVEAVKYKNASLFVSIDDIKGIYGEDFDPIASSDWCVSADGQSVAKASDYYTGNYGDFLRRIDGEIKAATDPVIKDKLLRQKADADKMVDRVDPFKMSFNLFSPFVTMEEKADFLRRFVDPRFAIGYDEDGKAVIEIEPKGDLTERDKLLKRMAIYLKNGTRTLGGIAVPDEAAALANLRKMTETAAAQFSSWTKANPAIMTRLSDTANDPERLYFNQVDDESPMEIPGLNPEFRMNGYKFADIRKLARNFSGINGYGVGLGKTSLALAAVQHIQNIGVKNKTLFVVPNSVLSNWRKESSMVLTDTIDCLYVGLEVGKDGSAKVKSKNYDTDLMRILENRHKKIFVTMEAFARLRLRMRTAENYDAYLASVDQSYADSDDKKKSTQAEGKRAKLIHNLVNSSSKSAAAPYFEDLGIDSIVIDEAHAYKNSSEVNDFKGGKYLSLAGSSDRGDDAQAKTWFVRKQSGDRGDGVLCLTATPVTNSPLEIYSMLSLSTGHKRLNDMMMGIKGADQFMKTMCVLEGKQETAIDGTEKDYDVFTGMTNVSVLRGAIAQVCVIKTAADVGAMVKLPEADETPVSVQLPADVVETLIDYQQAFRFALDTISEKKDVRGDAAAYDRVAAKFGEPMELIGHPFNLINKMTALILDKELDDRGTFYTFDEAARSKAEKVVVDYNAKAPVEERPRAGPQTRPEGVVGTKTKKDGDEKVTLLQIKALARIEGNRIIIDTINPETQTKFEDLADKAGLDLDVTAPPKLAALIDNFKKEEATPRGVGDNGMPTGRVKQIIFCDQLPLHNKIKRLLTKRCGVAAGSIAIITGTVNGKPEEIMDVQDGFNAEGEDNKYRVVIANEKAEVGINLQRGTQAIHHLTIGWTPDSLTQRNGRGVRQGNKTDRVTVYQYDADGTFDSYKRKLVGKKAEWIDNVMSKDGGDHVEIEGGLSDEAQEALIDSIGDANGMSGIQARLAAEESRVRAATNQAKQVVNLQTAIAQTAFLAKYAKATAWAADKMAAYVTVNDQLNAIKARLTNPKLNASTIIRMEALQADLTVRANGMKSELVESLEVYKTTGYGKDRAATGEPVSLDAMILDAIGYGIGRGETKESKIRTWFDQSWGMLKTVKEGSPIENEWRSEVDMARAMIDESNKDFAAMAGRSGAYSAEILKHIESGDAVLIDGKVICKGAFVRTKKGDLTAIYKLNGKFAARNGIDFSSVNAVDAMRGGEIILPGSSGFDACLDEAAKMEDEYLGLRDAVTGSTLAALLSSIVPEIAQRRKAVFDVGYTVRDFLLPHPYFPVVITPSQAKTGKVLAAIYESQKSIVKSVVDAGYYPEFRVDSSVVISSDRASLPENLYLDYARAHGLKITFAELSEMDVSRISELMAPGVLDTFTAEVLDGALSEEALVANLDAWLKKALPDYDLTSDPKYQRSPADFLERLTGKSYEFNARRASLNMGKTPEQAEQAAEVDPNRMVGVNGNTIAWKDRLKEQALRVDRFKPAIWDRDAQQWNVTYKAWQTFIEAYPAADKELSIVEATAKTSASRYRRR